MTKLHYIADESLGGIMREYEEVARKADVGDFVIITSSNDFTVGTISKCVKLCDTYYAKDGSIFLEERVSAQVGGYVDCSEDSYRTLEPTDIVQIDGERYRLVDRKSEVGEKLLAVSYLGDRAVRGETLVCSENSEYDDGSIDAKRNLTDEEYFFFDTTSDKYLVLEPVAIAKPTHQLDDLLSKCTSDKRHEESPPYETDKLLDLLANLARRVTSLESHVESLSSQLRDTQRNIETFAQQTEHNSEDIRTLDERTQVIGAINSYYGSAR